MQTPPSQSRQIRQFLAAFPPTAWHIVLGFILLCFVSGWIFVVLALFDPPLRTALKDVTEIIRNVLIGLLGILAGGIGLYLAFIRSIAMRQSAEAASHASAIADRKETREKASTAKALAIDSLTRAIEQLGHGDISVRLGGIHALDRLARNDPSETQTVAEILAAHVRQSSDKSFPNDRSEWHLEIQLCILKLGAYRRLLPVLQFDLRESDLRGLDFSGLDFSDSRFDGTNFSNSKIFGSKFSACSINNVTFNKVNLYNVDFANANFNQANFMGCHVKGSNFSAARFSNCNFSMTDFGECKFIMARFRHGHSQKVRFKSCELQQSALTRIDFKDSKFISSSMTEARIRYSTFTDSLFYETTLSIGKLEMSELNSCKFVRVEMVDTSLQSTKLDNCGFYETDLDKVKVKPRLNNAPIAMTKDDEPLPWDL